MIKQACGDDVKRFCQEVKPGGGRIVQCLEEHAKDLSQDCSKLMEKRAQKKIAQPKTSQ
ncbi:MAG: cysteine rich repeat-containing protein [Nitrospiraceae bacterium]